MRAQVNVTLRYHSSRALGGQADSYLLVPPWLIGLLDIDLARGLVSLFPASVPLHLTLLTNQHGLKTSLIPARVIERGDVGRNLVVNVVSACWVLSIFVLVDKSIYRLLVVEVGDLLRDSTRRVG